MSAAISLILDDQDAAGRFAHDRVLRAKRRLKRVPPSRVRSIVPPTCSVKMATSLNPSGRGSEVEVGRESDAVVGDLEHHRGFPSDRRHLYLTLTSRCVCHRVQRSGFPCPFGAGPTVLTLSDC